MVVRRDCGCHIWSLLGDIRSLWGCQKAVVGVKRGCGVIKETYIMLKGDNSVVKHSILLKFDVVHVSNIVPSLIGIEILIDYEIGCLFDM